MYFQVIIDDICCSDQKKSLMSLTDEEICNKGIVTCVFIVIGLVVLLVLVLSLSLLYYKYQQYVKLWFIERPIRLRWISRGKDGAHKSVNTKKTTLVKTTTSNKNNPCGDEARPYDYKRNPYGETTVPYVNTISYNNESSYNNGSSYNKDKGVENKGLEHKEKEQESKDKSKCFPGGDVAMPYNAFISYSHLDEDYVKNQLVRVLEGGMSPYKLCLQCDWIPGKYISNQIKKCMQESRCTILVLSPNFMNNVWGNIEVRAAHETAIKEGKAELIVILYGMDNMKVDMFDGLKVHVTYIKYGNGEPEFWDKLAGALKHE